MSSWDEIAPELRDQFYGYVGKDAERLYKRLSSIDEVIKKPIRNALRGFFVKLGSDGRWYGRLSAVDGSTTPSLSMRLGITYALFSVVVVRDVIDREESNLQRKLGISYEANGEYIDYPNTYVLRRKLEWKMALKERRAALNELRKSDIVILDGSFFGYLYGIYKLIKYGGLTREIKKIAGEITRHTIKLAESGRTIGVVKRGRTSAIVPWAYIKGIVDRVYDLRDRSILSIVQPTETILYYRRLLGGRPWMYRVYSRLIKRGSFSKDAVDDAIDHIKKAFSIAIESVDSTTNVDEVLNLTERAVVRHYEAAPVEIDLPVDRDDCVDVFIGDRRLFNDSTNLPYANDIADLESNLPRKFSKDFTDEVEATLIRKYDIDPNLVRAIFTNVNPQKDVSEG